MVMERVCSQCIGDTFVCFRRILSTIYITLFRKTFVGL